MLSRADSVSLVDIAYDAITGAIVDRRLEPGSRVTIDGLAAELDMSTTPVREALSRIASQALLVQSRNRGYTVAPMLSIESYHQLFQFRRLLEVYAAQRVRFEPSTVERVTALAVTMPGMDHGVLYRDNREFTQADHEFHRSIIAMAGDPFVARSWAELHFHLHVARLYSKAGLIDFGDAAREHAVIADALRAEDREALVRAITDHIAAAERRLEALVSL